MNEYAVKVFKGMEIKVLEGTKNAGRIFEVSTDDPIEVGTTEVEFAEVVRHINARVKTVTEWSSENPVLSEGEIVIGTNSDGTSILFMWVGDGTSSLLSLVPFVDKTVTPTIMDSSGVPDYTPYKSGDIYVDSQNGHIYMAKGTSSSADWVRVDN